MSGWNIHKSASLTAINMARVSIQILASIENDIILKEI